MKHDGIERFGEILMVSSIFWGEKLSACKVLAHTNVIEGISRRRHVHVFIENADAKPPLPSWVFVRLGCSECLLGSRLERAEIARDCQRSPKSGPRAAQEQPKSAPRAAKERPRGPKSGLRTPKNTKKAPKSSPRGPMRTNFGSF